MSFRHVETILAVLPDMLFELSEDGHYLDVFVPQDAVYSPTTHGPSDGLIGKHIYDVIDKEGADIALDAVKQALATRALVKAKWSRTFPDGALRHYEARVAATPDNTTLIHISDLTDDKDRKDRLEGLYAALPLIVCHVDRGGRLVDIHGQNLFDPNLLRGASIDNIPEPDLAKRVRGIHSRALTTDDTLTFRFLYNNRHYVARARRTQLNTVVFVVQDETDQHTTLSELRRSNEYLQRFASVASHDLQEPLRGMHGPAQILLEELGPSLSEEHRKWLRYIMQNAIRAQAMVRDMLQFSRAGTQMPSPTVFDGYDAVWESLESFRLTIQERHAKVTVGHVPSLYYDRVKFGVMISNLLSNGLKFARPDVPPEVHIDGATAPDGSVVITVQDNGIGIPSEAQYKILEPGQRLHHRDAYPGNGLGLSSVVMILERCGGSIAIQSEVGKGTSVILTLPGEHDSDHD